VRFSRLREVLILVGVHGEAAPGARSPEPAGNDEPVP
jgi:hypothetical protein